MFAFFNFFNTSAQSLSQKVTDAKNTLNWNGFTVIETYSLSATESSEDFVFRKIYGDHQYAIIAVGESGITDLDFCIQDSYEFDILCDEEEGDYGSAEIVWYQDYDEWVYLTAKIYDAYNYWDYFDIVIVLGYKN